MPLVKPRNKEKREDFLERCMGDKTSVDDFPSRGQRFAVCNALYNRRDKKEENSMEDIKGMAEAIKSLTGVIEKGYHKKPKDKSYHDDDDDKMGHEEDDKNPKMGHGDDEDKPKGSHKDKDVFSTEDEARARAKEIGGVGIHSHMDNGKRIYMPCATHDAYDEAMKDKGAHKPDEEKPGKPKDELEEMGMHKKPV